MDFSKRIQKYVNYATVEEAMADGYDIVQPKYDGWWARCVIENGQYRIYSRQGQEKAAGPVPAGTPNAVLIGEYIVGTQRAVSGSDSSNAGRLVVFDAVVIQEGMAASAIAIHNRPYYERLAMSLKVIKHVEWMSVAEGWAARTARDKWEEWVDNGGAEGIVLRNGGDNYVNATIARVKKTVTMDYVVIRVAEGGGKNKGKAGAVVCGLYENGRLVEKVSVGGGWSDRQRLELFTQPEQYIGRVLEVRGYQVFASGSMRHPNAARWREDKTPAECVWNG